VPDRSWEKAACKVADFMRMFEHWVLRGICDALNAYVDCIYRDLWFSNERWNENLDGRRSDDARVMLVHNRKFMLMLTRKSNPRWSVDTAGLEACRSCIVCTFARSACIIIALWHAVNYRDTLSTFHLAREYHSTSSSWERRRENRGTLCLAKVQFGKSVHARCD